MLLLDILPPHHATEDDSFLYEGQIIDYIKKARIFTDDVTGDDQSVLSMLTTIPTGGFIAGTQTIDTYVTNTVTGKTITCPLDVTNEDLNFVWEKEMKGPFTTGFKSPLDDAVTIGCTKYETECSEFCRICFPGGCFT